MSFSWFGWLRTGSPGRDIPERYGPWQTCYERYRRWDGDGIWVGLLEYLQVKGDSLGVLDLDVVAVDSSIARAHRQPTAQVLSRWPSTCL